MLNIFDNTVKRKRFLSGKATNAGRILCRALLPEGVNAALAALAVVSERGKASIRPIFAPNMLALTEEVGTFGRVAAISIRVR